MPHHTSQAPPGSINLASRDVAYNPDAAAQFAAMASARNSVLLESADIESKRNLTCLAALESAARITCRGNSVEVLALTESGALLLDALRRDETVAGHCQGGVDTVNSPSLRFEFPHATEPDERARLKAASPSDVLKAISNSGLFEGTELPLLAGGFSFDYLGTFEELPEVGEGDNDFPDYEFFVAEAALLIDHDERHARIEAWGSDPAAVQAKVDSLAAAAALADAPPAAPRQDSPAVATPSVSDAEFSGIVGKLQEHIHAGDVYQVVPSRAFRMECPDALAAYRTLRELNPSPYMFFVRGDGYQLFGASPESSLKFTPNGRRVGLNPIAGTRPRGRGADGEVDHELDCRHELQLRTDAKEIAEHTMLVDLARNDLARIAAPGSRKVESLMDVDRYSRVMHLVSRVSATLDEDFDALDAYRACMNMGTLTGAPKLRATELLREVEGVRRGSYGGAVGYLRGDGTMDTCIVIRSAYVTGGTAIVQAGAGVVNDSEPASEAAETLHKAYAVLHAIARAHGQEVEVLG